VEARIPTRSLRNIWHLNLDLTLIDRPLDFKGCIADYPLFTTVSQFWLHGNRFGIGLRMTFSLKELLVSCRGRFGHASSDRYNHLVDGIFEVLAKHLKR